MKNHFNKLPVKSPVTLLLVILLTTFVVEYVIMVLLESLLIDHKTIIYLFDSAALSLSLFIPIYFLVHRRIVRYNKILEVANLAFKANEEKIWALLDYNEKIKESSPAGILVVDLKPVAALRGEAPAVIDALITDINPALCAIWGRTAAELIGKSFVSPSLLDDEGLETIRLELIQRRQGDKGTYEVRLRHNDGHLVPVLIHASPLSVDGEGHTCQSMGIVIDLTQRKLDEEKLRESEERFKGAFTHSAIGMALVSTEGKWLKVNNSLCSMLGYGEPEFLSLSFQEITHPDDLEADLAFVRQMLNGDIETYQMEKRYFHKVGHTVSVLLSVSLVRDRQNAPLYFVAQIEDISTRKKAEHRLRLLAKVFENSSDGIVITDVQGTIEDTNQAFSTISGYRRDEIIGKTPRLLKSDRHSARFYAAMWDALRNKGSWDGEIWNRHKNGTIYPAWLRINAISQEGGDTSHYVGLISDITAQKSEAEKLEYLATHDGLTGLPNRTALLDRLQQAINRAHRKSSGAAVLFVDLNDFKPINDTHGHEAGDSVLKNVATLLITSVRESDTVGRLGGDEFLIVLEDVDTPDHIEPVARKIIEKMQTPMLVNDLSFTLGASIGVALYPGDGRDVDTLLNHADIAMYAAKKGKKNDPRHCLTFFTVDLPQRL